MRPPRSPRIAPLVLAAALVAAACGGAGMTPTPAATNASLGSPASSVLAAPTAAPTLAVTVAPGASVPAFWPVHMGRCDLASLAPGDPDTWLATPAAGSAAALAGPIEGPAPALFTQLGLPVPHAGRLVQLLAPSPVAQGWSASWQEPIALPTLMACYDGLDAPGWHSLAGIAGYINTPHPRSAVQYQFATDAGDWTLTLTLSTRLPASELDALLQPAPGR